MSKPNGKAATAPREIFIVIFADGAITSFLVLAEAERFQKQLKQPTRLERYLIAPEAHAHK